MRYLKNTITKAIYAFDEIEHAQRMKNFACHGVLRREWIESSHDEAEAAGRLWVVDANANLKLQEIEPSE